MLYTLPLEIERHFYTILSRKYSVFLIFPIGQILTYFQKPKIQPNHYAVWSRFPEL